MSSTAETDVPTAPLTGAELLAAINPRLSERGARICLRPDLLTDWETLTEELGEASAEADRAHRSSTTKLGAKSSSALRDLAEKVQAVEEQIAASEVRFVFRAMAKDRWQELCDQHPPRPTDQVDQYVGYNRVAVADAAVRAALISPVFEDCTKPGCPHVECGSWQQFLSVCNPSEWGELRNVVDTLNGVVTGAPKSELASQILGGAGGASRRPRRGA